MITTEAATRTALVVAGGSSEVDLTAVLRDLGFEPTVLASAEELHGVQEPVALCIIDLHHGSDALRTVRAVRSQHPECVIIGVVDPKRPTMSADAIRAGVFDVLPRPATSRDLAALVANAREQTTLATAHALRADGGPAPYGIFGTSPAMRLVLDLVPRAAAGRCGILVVGERGTGREMVARAIHAHEPNGDTPFVKVDCAGPSPEEIELQLFGVLARQGAHAAPEHRSLERIGGQCRLRDAHGGILFLENVVDLPARVQARLVRVLRDREAFIDDETEPQALDVRPIAAVDTTIDTALEEGRLRPDLYERLSLIRVDVPALRQRREDIPVLATHFLKDVCRANGKPIKTLTRPALTLLAALPWRGNAPQLRGLLERLTLLVPHGLIRLEDVLAHTQLDGAISPSGFDATLRQARARFERDYIAAVLQHHHGRIAEAARVLGIQRTNLYRKMRRLNLMRAGKSGREA